MSPVTLSVLTVVLLVGSPVNQRPDPMMMEHWIEYPPPARSTVIEPGRPAHWDVYLVDEPKPFTVVVTARNEDGEKWDRLVVRVVFDFWAVRQFSRRVARIPRGSRPVRIAPFRTTGPSVCGRC
jgi:hypothetical protein